MSKILLFFKPFIFSVIWLNLTLFNIPNIRAETILEEIDRTGLLKVGIRTDVIPFAYRNNEGQLQGICIDLIRIIRQELAKKIDRNIISILFITSSLDDRFTIIENKVAHFECGPNTIRELEDYQVKFSEPFFLSGLQIIASENIADKLINSQGKNFKIGVLKSTTSEIFIKEKYPEAQQQLFEGIRGNERAIQALRQGRIDAFVDDAVLLLGLSLSQGISLKPNQGFTLTPPLTCEKYGLIIPKNDDAWGNFINSAINSFQKKGIISQWFTDINLGDNSLTNCE